HVKRGWDTKLPQSSGPPIKVGDDVVYKELGDRMERAATTASRLEAEQDSGSINRTQSMATLNEPITQEEPQQDDSVPTPSMIHLSVDAQVKEIANLKKRVQRLEKKKKSRTTGFKRLKKVGMSRRVKSSEDHDSLGDPNKGKAIMIEPKVPLKKKDQVALDEDLARNLQAQLEAELIEEEKLARKQQEEEGQHSFE
ncbi:hypothetical protein Tco_0865438, partial [Tanacetum coccineum]